MRIIFMGTPDFAVPSLSAILGAGHEVLAVYTQPDRPKGRGMRLQPSPVKEYACSGGLSVFQPHTLKDDGVFFELAAFAPDFIVVAAYGKLLPKRILDLPRFGCINVHASLLPKYRGAAPVHYAILNGETRTGVTIMHMAEGLDTGDMILSESLAIAPDETTEELTRRLALLGAGLLPRAIEELSAGRAVRTPQDAARATFAPSIQKAQAEIDWNRTAAEIHNQVRAFSVWPKAEARIFGKPAKVLETSLSGGETDLRPGAFLGGGAGIFLVSCGGRTILRIERLQLPGKNPMRAAEFLRGHRLCPEELLDG